MKNTWANRSKRDGRKVQNQRVDVSEMKEIVRCDRTLFIQCISMGVLNGSVETKTKIYGDIGSWHSEMSDWVNNAEPNENKKKGFDFHQWHHLMEFSCVCMFIAFLIVYAWNNAFRRQRVALPAREREKNERIQTNITWKLNMLWK